jgi:hypothetical protein
MFPKATSCALFAAFALSGAPEAAVSGGDAGTDAQPLTAAQPAAPGHVAPTTKLVPPTTKLVAAAGSTGSTVVSAAIVKLTTGTTSGQIVRGPTSWAVLNQAIARIPNYRSGVATWLVTGRYGRWGATDLANGDIYLSPNIPTSKLYSVATHEYAHARAFYNYGWNQQAANLALNQWFGGGVVTARERAADCMAIAQGATWTNYTSCQNAHWRQGGRILLAGRRLP